MNLKNIITKTKFIIQEQGILFFIFFVLCYIKNSIYFTGIYDIYETRLPLASYPVCNLGNNLIASIETVDELQRLSKAGFNFKGILFQDKIAKGAMAFCIFVEKELAHVTWVAFNENIKKEIDPLPFKVDFNNKEVCSGASFTDPSQRGRGLFKAVYCYMFLHLNNMGIVKVITSIEKNNIPSQRALSHSNPSLIGEGYYLKIFMWKYWKETRKG